MNMKFYKLYTPPAGRRPDPKIDVYYDGRPLFVSAVFESDRYSFRLPLNLSDKMITGNLYADLCYSAPELGSKRNPTPVSIILSDRYD
jgi:hypothetical protein